MKNQEMQYFLKYVQERYANKTMKAGREVVKAFTEEEAIEKIAQRFTKMLEKSEKHFLEEKLRGPYTSMIEALAKNPL